jgi:hypothetical protein
MQFACKVTLKPVRLKTVALEKQYLLHCVSVALIIRHATRMRRITLPSVACLALPHFSTLFHNGTIFGEKYFT